MPRDLTVYAAQTNLQAADVRGLIAGRFDMVNQFFCSAANLFGQSLFKPICQKFDTRRMNPMGPDPKERDES